MKGKNFLVYAALYHGLGLIKEQSLRATVSKLFYNVLKPLDGLHAPQGVIMQLSKTPEEIVSVEDMEPNVKEHWERLTDDNKRWEADHHLFLRLCELRAMIAPLRMLSSMLLKSASIVHRPSVPSVASASS